MPERSSSSHVVRWPKRAEVELALRSWAEEELRRRPELLRLGYFGSYARGEWGVGSDVDLVAIVETSATPALERSREFDLSALPVPADLFVYTCAEWEAALARGEPFFRSIAREVCWVGERDARP